MFNFGVDLGDYNFTWLSNCVILNLVFSCSILEGITLTLNNLEFPAVRQTSRLFKGGIFII